MQFYIEDYSAKSDVTGKHKRQLHPT